MLHGKLLVAVAGLLVLAGGLPLGPVADRPGDPLQGGLSGVEERAPNAAEGPGLSALEGRNAPEFIPLFAPPRTHTEAYRAYVSPLDLGTVLQRLEHDPSLLHPPGAWIPAALLPFDAFGQTGGYERWKLARLYGARRALVARGPRGSRGRPTQAWTLISPYPDRDFERLEPGTLVLVLVLTTF
jgi:hypothetical protein